MRWLDSLTLAAQRCTSWWLRTNGLTFLLFLLSHGLSTFNHILCNHKRVFLLCYLDDPTHLHVISYSVTSYDLDKFSFWHCSPTRPWWQVQEHEHYLLTQQWASTCIRATPHKYSGYHCPEKHFKREHAVQPRFWSILYFFHQTRRENNSGWSW